ncbi:MAG: hypothetical protein M0R77_00450 [Gammaproteobacteria bacterium]|nr:hypothetical protein [Acholeplasmataceae bacterium]MCK9529024.1 hypothetical protein [Gammaproteobacteria bacterium]
MDNITRTIYGSTLQTYMFLGKTVRYVDNTTLNERFDILRGTLPTAGQTPKMGYFSIGNGGHRAIIGENGITINNPVIHLATDAAAFKPMPFVLVDPAADLPPAECAKYALRRPEQIKGKAYIAYYLRRIENISNNVEMEIKVVDGDTEVSSPFVPTEDNLYPEPPDLTPENINVLDGQYAVASSKLSLSFTRAEVDHLRNVAKVLYDSEHYAIISEIQMVCAVDYPIQVSQPGGSSFSFLETIGALVAAHLNVYYQMVYLNNSLEIAVDAGAQEPLFKTELLVTP